MTQCLSNVSTFREHPEELDEALVDAIEPIDQAEPDESVVPTLRAFRKRKRRTGARPKTLSVRLLKRETLRHRWEHNTNVKILRARFHIDDIARPITRADCVGAERPCPWVGCKYHLFLSVNPDTGSITFNFPDRDIDDLKETCGLDVADRGGITLEEVGELTNVTRERIRQVETKALDDIKALPATASLK